MPGGRALDGLTGARDDLQRGHGVDLGAEVGAGAADAAGGEGAADGQFDVVGEDRRGQAVGDGGGEHGVPEGSGLRGDGLARGVDGDGGECAQVDHRAALDLGLSVGLVALAAGCDGDVERAGEADQGGDVVDRAGQQDGGRGAVDDVAVVVLIRGEFGRQQQELAVQGRRQAGEIGLGVRGRRPRSGRRAEPGDGGGAREGEQETAAAGTCAHVLPQFVSGRPTGDGLTVEGGDGVRGSDTRRFNHRYGG